MDIITSYVNKKLDNGPPIATSTCTLQVFAPMYVHVRARYNVAFNIHPWSPRVQCKHNSVHTYTINCMNSYHVHTRLKPRWAAYKRSSLSRLKLSHVAQHPSTCGMGGYTLWHAPKPGPVTTSLSHFNNFSTAPTTPAGPSTAKTTLNPTPTESVHAAHPGMPSNGHCLRSNKHPTVLLSRRSWSRRSAAPYVSCPN